MVFNVIPHRQSNEIIRPLIEVELCQKRKMKMKTNAHVESDLQKSDSELLVRAIQLLSNMNDRLSALEAGQARTREDSNRLSIDPQRETVHWKREQGRILRSIRKQRGLTLESLESRVGISRSTLSRIEVGQASLGLSELESILEVLSYPYEEFHQQILRGLDPSSTNNLVQMYRTYDTHNMLGE